MCACELLLIEDDPFISARGFCDNAIVDWQRAAVFPHRHSMNYRNASPSESQPLFHQRVGYLKSRLPL